MLTNDLSFATAAMPYPFGDLLDQFLNADGALGMMVLESCEEALMSFGDFQQKVGAPTDLVEVNRAAAQMFYDVYEATLESIVSFHEIVASQSPIDWIAAAGKAQARLTRELVNAQLAIGRELLQ